MAPVVGIRELQEAGLDAYRVLFDALQGEERLDPKQLELARSLPPPHVAIPLGVLTALARSARAGELENFYTYPTTDDERPASEPIRRWLDENREPLEQLVPERSGWNVPEWTPPRGETPTDAGRLDWQQLIGTATQVAEATGSLDAGAILFVLVRDWAFDLEPLLAELELDLAQLLDELGPQLQSGAE